MPEPLLYSIREQETAIQEKQAQGSSSLAGEGEAQEGTFLPSSSQVPHCFCSAVWLGSGSPGLVPPADGDRLGKKGLPRVPLSQGQRELL